MMGISMTMGYETVLYAGPFETYNWGRVADSKKMHYYFGELNLLLTYLLTHSFHERESFLRS